MHIIGLFRQEEAMKELPSSTGARSVNTLGEIMAAKIYPTDTFIAQEIDSSCATTTPHEKRKGLMT